MIKEKWKVVVGYEGIYEVSNHGRVRSLVKKEIIIMSQYTHYKGHKFIYLSKKGRKKFFVHRLVACAFILNPDNKSLVNHIDENKQNNIVTNLEWMTDGENTRYYWARKGIEINNNIPF